MLRRVKLKGFKSVKEMDLELRPLNVMIGANGTGKSNLISFFKMLNALVTRMGGGLQNFVAGAGRAHSLLHYGPKKTPQLDAALEFETDFGDTFYQLQLVDVAGDTLAFAGESFEFLANFSRSPDQPAVNVPGGHLETRLPEFALAGNQAARNVNHWLSRYRAYQFHDTSPQARVRDYCHIWDNRPLKHDAGNLAAFLLRLREENDGAAYNRIVAILREIAPFFDDFVLEKNDANRDVMLNWREQESDVIFGAHQLSDGTLRATCLAALLLQPDDQLPDLLIVDEPELGLHPYALNIIASLFKKASHHTQVLVSTQSSAFLDHFNAEDIIVVQREGKESKFTRPDAQQLDAWLQDYSLGEIWEKNVIGGGPH